MDIRQVRARLSEAAKQRAIQEPPTPEVEPEAPYSILEGSEAIFAADTESPVEEVTLRYTGLAIDPAAPGSDETILYGRHRNVSRGDYGAVSRRISSQDIRPDGFAALRLSNEGIGGSMRAMAESMNALARAAGTLHRPSVRAARPDEERDDAEAFGPVSYVGYPAYMAATADAMVSRAESLERFISALLQLGQRSARREGWVLGRYNTDQHQISDSDVRRAGQSLFSRINDATPRTCFFIGYGSRRAVVASADNDITGQVVIVRVGQGYSAPQTSRLVTADALDAVTGEMVFRYLAGRRNREVGE